MFNKLYLVEEKRRSLTKYYSIENKEDFGFSTTTND